MQALPERRSTVTDLVCGARGVNKDFKVIPVSSGLGKGNLSMGANRLEKIDVDPSRLCQQILAPLRG